jgi:hypothetical protein
LTGGSNAATPACDANLLLLVVTLLLVGPVVPAQPSPLPPMVEERGMGD